jgi:hypothetical protein
MARLILPGDRPARGGLTIFVPQGYERADGPRPIYECMVPTDDEGTPCGRLFFVGEERAVERHMAACARAHVAEIRGRALKRRMPVFDPDSWSPDAEAHVKKVGRRMLAEGRLTMKPHERIHNE